MEEVQRKGAVHTLLDWFRPQQGAGDAIHPAGVQTTDNTDETAREDGVSVLRKFVGKKVGVTKPLLAFISLLLLSGVLLRVCNKYKLPILSSPTLTSNRLSSHDEWTPHYNNIQDYFDDLKDAQEKMNAAWDNSGYSVQQAFQKYFMPSLDDGQALAENPLAVINDHVAKMLECEFPDESSAEVLNDSLQHLQLLVSMCRMVTIRLKELEHSVSLESGIEEPESSPGLEDTLSISSSIKADDLSGAVGIVGNERRQSGDGKVEKKSGLEVQPSPSFHEKPGSNYETEEPFNSMKADDFLAEVGMLGSEWTQSVNAESASSLVGLFMEASNHTACNLEARYYFERFLQPFGDEDAVKATPSSAKHEIPYSGQPFRTGALAQAAARIFRESEDNTDYERVRKIHRIADSWTDEGVNEAIKQQKEENMYNLKQRLLIRREQMRVLLEKGIQNSDLEMNVLFLL